MVGREVQEEQIRSEAASEHGEIGELACGVDSHRMESRRTCSVGDAAGTTEKTERERLKIRPKQG